MLKSFIKFHKTTHIQHCRTDKQEEKFSVYEKLEYNRKRLKACDQLGSTQGSPRVVTRVDLNSALSLSLYCFLNPIYILDLRVHHSVMT